MPSNDQESIKVEHKIKEAYGLSVYHTNIISKDQIPQARLIMIMDVHSGIDPKFDAVQKLKNLEPRDGDVVLIEGTAIDDTSGEIRELQRTYPEAKVQGLEDPTILERCISRQEEINNNNRPHDDKFWEDTFDLMINQRNMALIDLKKSILKRDKVNRVITLIGLAHYDERMDEFYENSGEKYIVV